MANDASKLYNLAAELRLNIYSHVGNDNRPARIDMNSSGRRAFMRPSCASLAALSRTCRLFNGEVHDR
jgi:hypothetical protein